MPRLDVLSRVPTTSAIGRSQFRTCRRAEQRCDEAGDIVNEVADPKLILKYKKTRVALSLAGSLINVLSLWPKQKFEFYERPSLTRWSRRKSISRFRICSKKRSASEDARMRTSISS